MIVFPLDYFCSCTGTGRSRLQCNHKFRATVTLLQQIPIFFPLIFRNHKPQQHPSKSSGTSQRSNQNEARYTNMFLLFIILTCKTSPRFWRITGWFIFKTLEMKPSLEWTLHIPTFNHSSIYFSTNILAELIVAPALLMLLVVLWVNEHESQPL